MSCAPGRNCCRSCSTLGDYNPLLPGHAIPYQLSPSEIQAFLAAHIGDATLQRYLESGDPPYGVIVQEAYGELLVWFDASARLRVVDVTNMSIAQQVKQAPFESPDSGFFENLQHSFDDLFHGLQGGAIVLGVVALGFLVWRAAK